MRRSFALAAVPLLLAAVLGAGCRHHPARAVPVSVPLTESYCWWTARRTNLPPDTVAARFATAFTAVGLTGAAWTRAADTAWAHAGPTPLDRVGQRVGAGASYEGRAVAYRHGDSTRFRYFVAVAPPSRSTPQPAGRGERPLRQLDLCVLIARAAAIRSSAPGNPTAEDSLGVWTRIP